MNTVSPPLGGVRLWRGIVLPVAVATVAMALALVGALLVRGSTGIDGVNLFVETLSGRSSSFLAGGLAPLGFALVAGVAAAFNPCGFAMLPAYMGLYLGTSNEQEGRRAAQDFAKALAVGGSVTAGFVLLFATAGVIIGIGARSVLTGVLPWLGLSIGVLLAIGGSWLLGGGKLYTAAAMRMANRMGNPGQTNVRGYFLFGLSYGTASLSCTLPIFLSVVGTSFAASTIATSFAQFVLYALGMGMVIIALTLSMAAFKGAVLGGFRRALPYVAPIGTWFMIVAGTYIVFYWLTIGGLLDGLG